MSSFPPALIMILGALLIPLFPGRTRMGYMLALPLAGLAAVLWAGSDTSSVEILGYTLELSRLDPLSRVFAILFHVAALIGVIYSLHERDTLQQVSALVYAGSAVAAVLAGDLITLFIAWELLALSSVFLVLARRQRRSVGVALRYLVAQITSGLLLLSGIVVHFMANDGDLSFGTMDINSTAGVLMLLAFGLKCGFPLLHTWIVDTYPASTPAGTLFLSGFTTKVAIYALARAFAGAEVLIFIGAAMAVFPIFWAVIENDLRKVLSYSMINQLGFMVVGVGVGGAFGVNGACAHAFADVFFKGLLFMSMGAVLHQTGTTKGSELGGLYRSMPFTTGCCLVGASSISAVPLFSGFVTKSLIMYGLLHLGGDYWIVALLLLFASAGVVEHAGIKIPFFAFFAHDSGKRPGEPPLNMRIAMGLGALICIGIGISPLLPGSLSFYQLLPHDLDTYTPFDFDHVLSQMQLLCFASLAVFGLMRLGLYPPEIPATHLDFDWFYRRGGRLLWRLLTGPLARTGVFIRYMVIVRLPAATTLAVRRDYQRQLPAGWRLELGVLLVILMLFCYLLYNFMLP